MIRCVEDPKYHYQTIFNTKTGSYIRFSDKPMASSPHLIDVGVMGSCEHGRSGLCLKAGIKCYQNGLKTHKPNMSLDDFKRIIDEIKTRTFEVALGGRGDPDMHENFEEILYYAATNHVVPNFTTSGLGMTPEKAAICKAYCGAVAVSAYSRVTDKPVIAWRKRLSNEEKVPYSSLSDVPTIFTLNNMNPDCYTEGENFVINNREYGWYYLHHFEKHQEMCMNGDYELYQVYEEKQEPNYTFKAIDMLLSAGVTTNIHFVLSNTTIDEAILRLKYKGFPAGINAVVFLLHKPVGLGDESDVLQYDDPKLSEFFALIDQQHDYKIGFDSCTIPAILNFSKHIDLNSVDTCEAARFSMYISSDMIALPCSFDNVNMKYAFDLKNGTIQDAWNSEAFNSFRNKFKTSCNNCPQYKKCLGGCPLEPSITLCKRKEKDNGCKK